MAAILNSVMLDSDTAILYRDNLFSSLRFTQKHSHSTLTLTQTNSIWLKLSHPSFSSQTHSHLPRLVPNICTKKLHSFILTQLDDGSHLEFCQFHSATAILDTDTLFSSLRITLKHSDSTLTLTQTNSIWLKFIHFYSTLWWQASWILSCWFQTLPSCIETTCFLLSDSLKNTLTPLWVWLKLIQSDSNSATLVFPLKLTHTCQD